MHQGTGSVEGINAAISGDGQNRDAQAHSLSRMLGQRVQAVHIVQAPKGGETREAL